MLWRVLSGIATVCFVIAGAAAMSRPDAPLWIGGFGFSAAISAIVALGGRVARWITLALASMAGAWAASLVLVASIGSVEIDFGSSLTTTSGMLRDAGAMWMVAAWAGAMAVWGPRTDEPSLDEDAPDLQDVG